jgi:hypothetical protein
VVDSFDTFLIKFDDGFNLYYFPITGTKSSDFYMLHPVIDEQKRPYSSGFTFEKITF